MRRKKIILPRIYRPSDGDPRRWHVEFSVFDEIAGKMQRFRKTEGFSKCTSEVECMANARRLKNKYTNRLLKGWTPFDDKSVIWEDSLEYQAIIKKNPPQYRTKKTVAYYSVKYMKSKDNLAKKTYQTYMSKLRTFRNWLKKNKLDDKDISLFTKAEATLFITDLSKNAKAGKTKNEYLRLLQNFWEFVKKERKQIINPWVDFEKYRNNSKPHIPFKKGVLQLLKVEISKTNPQLWLAAQFLYYCFIRPGELRQVQIKHIDIYDGKITLYSDMTKSNHLRVVEINETFLEILLSQYHLHKYPEDYYVFSKSGKPGLKPVGRDWFNKQFTKIRKRLKLPDYYKFYAFKHTGAVRALRAGADIKEIQHQMGHSSISITDEYLKSMVGYESEFFRKRMPEI